MPKRTRATALALFCALFASPAFALTDPIALSNDACIAADGDFPTLIAMAQQRGWRPLTRRELSEWADPSFDGTHTMTGWLVDPGQAPVALIFGEYLHQSSAMRAYAESGAVVVPMASDVADIARDTPRLAVGNVCAVRFRLADTDPQVAALRDLRIDEMPLGDPFLDDTDPMSDDDTRFWGRRGFRAVVWSRRQDPETITYIGSPRGGVIRVYSGRLSSPRN